MLKWHFCSLKCIFFPLAHDKTMYLYRGLKGVTRGYRGLQGVTGGYKGLQGVTGGYRGKRKIEMDLPKKRNLIKPSMLSI